MIRTEFDLERGIEQNDISTIEHVLYSVCDYIELNKFYVIFNRQKTPKL